MLRRLVWSVLVLAGLSMFLYQMISGILYYYSYPVSVNVRINYNDTLRFPALTLCNQNAFRKTVAAAELGWYDLLSDLYSGSVPFKDVDLTAYNATNISVYEIFYQTGHDKLDLIVSCTWDGAPCSPADDFVTTMTDYGKCFTFNYNPETPLHAKRTGTEGGLQLLLNVEQYEYMQGPNDGAGLRIHLHDQQEAPLIRDFGIAVPPGSHSLIGMTMIRVENLPEPHGQCDDTKELHYFQRYTKSNCFQECKHRSVHDACGCSLVDMKTDDLPYCTLPQFQTCVLDTIETFNNARSDCQCPVPCEEESLEYANSLGYISSFDALNFLSSPLTQQLQGRYTLANEVSQRVHPKIVEEDTTMITAISYSLQQLHKIMHNVLENLDITDKYIEDFFLELDKRIYFHYRKGLKEVLFIMEHDFVRGWTILEERTLPFLTLDFYELRGSFVRSLRQLQETAYNGTEQDRFVNLALWKNQENKFLERLDIVARVIDNVTEVHEKYKSGEPLLTYRNSLNRRYDKSWITTELLQAIVDDDMHDQDTFFAKIMERVDQFITAVNTYMEVGNNATRGEFIEESTLQHTHDLYRGACVYYNFNVFLYKERIVDGPVNIMNDKIDEFEMLNRTLATSRDEYHRGMTSLRDAVTDFEVNSLDRLRNLVDDANIYLQQTHKKKEQLAKRFLTKEITELVRGLELFFSDLRSKDWQLQQLIQNTQQAVEAIWTNMLSEYTTNNFYHKINEDFSDFLNDTDVYLPYFAELLDVTADSLANVSYEELQYRLNADFHIINTTEKLAEVEAEFSDILNRPYATKLLGTEDEVFLTALSRYISSLNEFLRHIEIDVAMYLSNFIELNVYMQELSYEEIIQQPAYDVMKLLGDIGGSVGLFLGASAMTLAELLDVIILQCIRSITR